MHFFKRIFKRSTSSCQESATSPDEVTSSVAPIESLNLVAQMGYHKLEPRQVLSATFNFAGGLLTLDGFDALQDLTFSQQDVTIDGSVVDAYVFDVGDGGWTIDGAANSDIEVEDLGPQIGGRLEVASSLLTNGVIIDGADIIGMTQATPFSISSFSASGLVGDVTLDDLSVTDVSDSIDSQISVETTGSIFVTGSVSNLDDDGSPSISLTANGTTSDITVDASLISSLDGNITLTAADEISLINSGDISAGMDGVVMLIANSDDAAGDSDSITMSDGSTIDSATGNISLAAIGDDGGSISLGGVTTTGDVSVDATGGITDATAAEIANVVGARVDLNGGSIGSVDDIDVSVDNLSFNSTGVVNITDLMDGVIVDVDSSALSGTLTANSPLTISADVMLAGSFTFTAGDSALAGDTITIDNDADVTLTAAANETLDFIAGDDILFDNGRVATTGGGTHTVNLTADNEGAGVVDADRGSINNTAGIDVAVTTNVLNVLAGAGVGDVGNGLRTSADSIGLTNIDAGDVFICETDDVELAGISNVGRDISIAAGGFLNITAAIDAGAGDVRLVANGDILQLVAGTITADELGVRQVATGPVGSNDLDANTRLDIRLDAANDVNTLGAFNAFDGGTVAFVDTDEVTIGAISAVDICDGVTFDLTTGVVTTSTAGAVQGVGDGDEGDILINAGGALVLDEALDAGAADVRISAVGDISQAAAGTITADELGVIQSGVVAGDIILDADNSVGFVAASNAFDTGVVAFNNQIDLAVDEVTAQTLGSATFATTTGITTNFTGVVTAGPGDVADGDILITSAAGLLLSQSVIAGGGTADVRLTANGLIDQAPVGLILADELGVRQEAVGDIDLCEDNNVNIAAISNVDGAIEFADVDGFFIGDVSAQTIGGVSFAATTGFVGGDITIFSGGRLVIDSVLSAGANDIRIIANGDVTQTAGNIITAGQLGVRQEATLLVPANDTSGNGLFDILLGDANDVDDLAAFNAFDRGVIVFNDVDDLTIGEVDLLPFCSRIFATTTGVSSTYTGLVLQGAGDFDDGDVLIAAGGFLQINESIEAGGGTADVRMTANGSIAQAVAGVILADELGVRQEAVGDIDLCEDNNVNVAAISNADGVIEFADVDRFRIGDVSAQTIDLVSFTATTGFVGDDITIFSGGSLIIDSVLSAGANDVRIIANGDVTQTAGNIITADQLGVRQEAIAVVPGNDTSGNGLYDILLGDANDVDELAAFNAFDGGVVVFNDIDGLTVGEVDALAFCSRMFATTTGVSSTFTGLVAQGVGDLADGDILIAADGFLQIDHDINAGAGTADVRLTANGDIHQSATAGIIADEVGVRQTETVSAAANNIDGNGRLDVLLDGVNDANFLAIENQFDDGVVTFSDVDDLTIATVTAQTINGVVFASTTSVSTVFAGAAVAGAGDTDEGDVILSAGGFLQINETIDVGTADLRINAGGDVEQLATTILVANELGVNQNSNVFLAANELVANGVYDIHLCSANEIEIFGAVNAFTGGDVQFDNTTGYTVGNITAQTIDEAVYAGANGIETNDGDVFLNSPGFLNLAAPIAAGTGTVRLVANGDIHQSATGGVVAGALGVRQESVGPLGGDDLDANLRFDIILDGNNNVGDFAAINLFDSGVIVFNETDGFTVSEVAALVTPGKTFALTTGIVTTFGGVAGVGAGDADSGDILLNTGGYLEILQPIVAGAGVADVRIEAGGDVVQDATGIILANELGVLQVNTTFAAANDLDGNGRYDVHLCHGNTIDIVAGENGFAGGEFLFNNSQRIVVGEISGQTIDGVTVATVTGISTNDGGVALQSAGSLNITETIDAGTGTVRLTAPGDIHQTASGTIVAGALGVRQSSVAYLATEDLDGNGRFDILLDDGNDVGILAADNLFTSGVVVFNDVDDLTVGVVTALVATPNCPLAMGAFTGITTAAIGAAVQGPGDLSDGDVLLNADGFLLIDEQIDAGGGFADVRLVADGDLHQTATGIILADELGARVESNVFSAANDIDGNGAYDIILCFDNQVSFFAAENQFDGGAISFNSVLSYEISDIEAQTIGNVSFTATSGVVSTGAQFLQASAGAINITTDIDAGAGIVYLLASGDVLQDPGVTITAAGLGVRQLATVYNAAEDLDGNGVFDIILTADNEVDMFAAENVFEEGFVAFRSIEDLTIFAIAETDFCDITFDETNGVQSQGDILIESEGFLNILAPINADDGLNDVRLIANGDIFQSTAGVISANFLGVRQQRLVFDPTHDINGDGEHDIRLCDDNLVNTFAAENTIGDINFHNDQGLTIGTVSTQTIGSPFVLPVDFITFATTTGVTAGGDAVVQADGNLVVDEAISAPDSIFLLADGSISVNDTLTSTTVRLVSNGDIVQAATGIITADQLGVRQEGPAAGSIVLDDANDVDVFAGFNAFEDGFVVFNDVDDLIIGTVATVTMDCGENFLATAGIDTEGDILVQAGGPLTVEQEINADGGLNDVRLIANGDVTQSGAGIIVANDLGVRQQSLAGDVILCLANDVDNLAVFNPVGDVHFRNVDDLTVSAVAAQTIGNVSFAASTGISTVGNSVIVNADGTLDLQRAIVADEVRLVSGGDMTQGALGTITADVLGVRQQSVVDGDIVLDDANDVNFFAAFNAFETGVVAFNDIDGLTISSVTAFVDCGFLETIGVDSEGDVLIEVGGALTIEQEINADEGADDVRLIANGDVTQTGLGIIVANDLGVRQEAAVGNVILCLANRVDNLSVFNPGGDVHFYDTLDLTVGDVPAQTIGNISFTVSSGISSVGNSVIVNTDGTLGITSAIVADEVRLVADGDVTQTATGTIAANLLGVRQQSITTGDIVLDDGNDVNIFAAFNAFEDGVVVFNDIDGVTIGTVAAAVDCGEPILATIGIDSEGDILIEAGGPLAIEQEINADDGADDVRLIANGNITQTGLGIIVADELGVRQEGPVGDVLLCLANGVNDLAVDNPVGDVHYHNDIDLTVSTVASQTIGNITFTGATGILATDNSVIVNSNGFLALQNAIDAGVLGAVRLVADGDVTQTAAGIITADLLGVRQQSVDGDIVLGESNDVDVFAAFNNDAVGLITMVDINDLTIGQVLAAVDCGEPIVTTTGITSIGAGNISVDANGTLDDATNIPITTGGNGFFRGGDKILLTNQTGDTFSIGGDVAFQSQDIEVGQDSVASGNGNVSFGTLNFNADTVAGQTTAIVDITQDDSMMIVGENRVSQAVLSSGVDIENGSDAIIELTQVQFNAENGHVFIGNQADDSFNVLAASGATEIELGVVAVDASIAANAPLQLNGNVPIAPALAQNAHTAPGDEFLLGTSVTSTLSASSLEAGGYIEQTDGDLNALNLGLAATQHVHLDSVSGINSTIAIQAGDSGVAVNTQQATLDALAGIDGSEVRPALLQSVSVNHLGTLTAETVVDPELLTALAGITTTATTDGSILLIAQNAIAIDADVMAIATDSLPQVTTYVTDGIANDASVITFGGGSIIVDGTLGTEVNEGTVTGSQTFAFFGLDSDLDGDIDTFLPGTTEIIRLDGSGTAEQLIRAQYGNDGEAGYRLGFVWDSQRRFDGGFAGDQEIPNLYTVNDSTESERYDVDIFDQDAPPPGTISIAGTLFTFETTLVEQVAVAPGDPNFDTLFVKMDPFTRDAILARRDDVRVFTTVEVRNDQDINLFVGPLGEADNSLNSITETLEAQLETSGVQVVTPPADFSRNPVVIEPLIVEAPRQIPFIPPFERQELVRTPDQGTLSYIAVEIGDADEDEYLASDYILDVDGELILKNPNINYEPLSEDDSPEEIDANKNEVAAIVAQIEADPEAEAGLWYKVFVDYEDGSGKKDEVLFYHFKTGDRPSEDLGPESDFADEGADGESDLLLIEEEEEEEELMEGEPAADGDPAADQELELNGPTDDEGALIYPSRWAPGTETNQANLVVENQTDSSLAGSEKLGISAGTVMLATLTAQQNRSDRATTDPLSQTESEIGFSRFDRLKRRVASLMGRAG